MDTRRFIQEVVTNTIHFTNPQAQDSLDTLPSFTYIYTPTCTPAIYSYLYSTYIYILLLHQFTPPMYILLPLLHPYIYILLLVLHLYIYTPTCTPPIYSYLYSTYIYILLLVIHLYIYTPTCNPPMYILLPLLHPYIYIYIPTCTPPI